MYSSGQVPLKIKQGFYDLEFESTTYKQTNEFILSWTEIKIVIGGNLATALLLMVWWTPSDQLESRTQQCFGVSVGTKQKHHKMKVIAVLSRRGDGGVLFYQIFLIFCAHKCFLIRT